MMEKTIVRCNASQRSKRFEGESLEFWPNNRGIKSLPMFLIFEVSIASCFSNEGNFR